MNEHLKLLGHRARDVVTGFGGVVVTVAFDLYGCVQVILQPNGSDEPKWFDAKRLDIVPGEPVMAQPTFELVPGPADKPAFQARPLP